MSAEKRPLLVVEDDDGLRMQMKWSLADYDVSVAGDRAQGLVLFEQIQPPVVVLDLGLPPDPNGASEGLATLESILGRQPLTKVIIASGNEERANALQAITAGAYDIYPKPIDPQVLHLIIRRAFYLYDLEAENLRLAGEHTGPLDGVIAASPQMIQICRMIERVSSANVSVLLTGQSGTGKEVLARAIHNASPRVRGPFVAINCAAIPDNLLESELFGHEKGAFTGAVKQTIGKVEQADGGTLFLDEIGDMPLALQAKLLRFLQGRVIERVGGRKEIEVDVRVVSATNSDLETKMKEGTFREDLFYRLNEIGIHVPPLRERQGDAVVLAKYFLGRYAKELGQPLKRFSSEAIAAISNYSWPGNVRELENKVKRSILMADGRSITELDLGLPGGDAAPMLSLREVRERAETEAVLRALTLTDDNISEAAQLLGVSRPTLYDLMKTANIKRK